MKTVVVGANGFLGSRLVDFLIQEGSEVLAIYNNNSTNINKSATVVPFENILKINTEIDFVYIVSGSFSSTHKTLVKINCQELQLLSEHFPRAKLIYVSSTNVYGESEGVSTELSTFVNPNVYGLSKIAGEFVVMAHEHYAIVRLCYLYGPKLNNNSFLPRLINQAITERKIILYGKGERMQDYLYVDDAAQICIAAAHHKQNGIFLGASGKSYSNNEIANLIKKQNPKVIVEYMGEETGKSLYYNPEKTFAALEIKPTVTFELGIKNMYNAAANLW